MSGNVWVKSGRVMNLFSGSGVTSTGAGSFVYKDSPKASFHATVIGTGTVTAVIDIEYSNDGTYALETKGGTITLSGSTYSSDGLTSDSPWKYVRANVTSISGTNATVQVTMGV